MIVTMTTILETAIIDHHADEEGRLARSIVESIVERLKTLAAAD